MTRQVTEGDVIRRLAGEAMDELNQPASKKSRRMWKHAERALTLLWERHQDRLAQPVSTEAEIKDAQIATLIEEKRALDRALQKRRAANSSQHEWIEQLLAERRELQDLLDAARAEIDPWANVPGSADPGIGRAALALFEQRNADANWDEASAEERSYCTATATSMLEAAVGGR